MAGKYAILMLPSLQQVLHGRDDRMWNKVIFLTMLMILSLCNYFAVSQQKDRASALASWRTCLKRMISILLRSSFLLLSEQTSLLRELIFSFPFNNLFSSSLAFKYVNYSLTWIWSQYSLTIDLKNQKHHLSFNTCFSCPFPWIFLTGTHRLLNRPCSPNYHFQTDSQAQPEGLPSLHTPCLPVPTSKGPVRRVYWHKVIR